MGPPFPKRRDFSGVFIVIVHVGSPRIGVVGIKGGWSSERLADAVAEATGYRLLVGMEKVRLDLAAGRATFGGISLGALDALIVKKISGVYSQDMQEALEVLRFLNESGLPMYSNPLCIMRVLNRLSCTVTLRAAGIPMPPTTITQDADEAFDALGEYGSAVFKPMYSTKARGMLVLRYASGAMKEIEAFRRENRVMYIQKVIPVMERDLGVVFMGGKYLTTYSRKKNGGSWTTSTHFGGTYEPYEPSPDIIALAERSQRLFGLDFTCVDVVLTDEGPRVFEVSAFGGFRGIQETSGMDAAKLYTEYVIGKLGGRG